jgi:hypothetical protein
MTAIEKKTKLPRVHSAQEEALFKAGYIRISTAAKRIGRPVFYLHREIKLGRLALGDKLTSDAIRVGYLFYVREAALAKLVGEAGAKLLGLKAG